MIKEPNDINAERSILGSLMLDNSAIRKCLKFGLNVRDFYLGSHQKVYNKILQLIGENTPVDLLTLANALKGDVSASYLTTLLEEIVSSANIIQYCKLVKEKKTLRDLQKVSKETLEALPDSAEELLNETVQKILYIKEEGRPHIGRKYWDLVEEVIEETALNIDKPLEFPLPYHLLEKATNGLHRGELTIVGGKQKVGKTCFMNSITYYLAQLNKKILLISGEMSDISIAKRFITMVSGKNMFSRSIKHNDISEIYNAIKQMKDWQLKIIFASMSILDIRIEIELYEPDVCFVDYIQIMDMPLVKNENRARTVGEFGKELKKLALKYNIPIVALSQLNDQEGFYESRALEQHCDNGWILTRKNEKTQYDAEEEILLNNKYNRTGTTGVETLIFNKKRLIMEEE